MRCRQRRRRPQCLLIFLVVLLFKVIFSSNCTLLHSSLIFKKRLQCQDEYLLFCHRRVQRIRPHFKCSVQMGDACVDVPRCFELSVGVGPLFGLVGSLRSCSNIFDFLDGGLQLCDFSIELTPEVFDALELVIMLDAVLGCGALEDLNLLVEFGWNVCDSDGVDDLRELLLL
jgi:hypothetical protein